MAFESGVLAKLEYPLILKMLANHCRFSVAVDLALLQQPSTDWYEVSASLEMTTEAVTLQTIFPEVVIGGARDIRGLAGRAEKGVRLQPVDLLLVQDMIVASRVFRRAFFRLPDREARFPRLSALAEGLGEFPVLEADIARSIGPRGDVLDLASPSLAQIRRDVRVAQSRLIERLNSLVTSSRYASVLQDAIVTTRDGRYVVPVKSEARASLPGIIHDTSSSGQTLFIEPFDIVELNNKLRERQLDEQHEIDRILDMLSALTGDHAAALIQSVEMTARIDLAMAKARLAFTQKASRPALHDPPAKRQVGDGHASKRIRLERARHPLLDPATVVPINLELGSSFRELVITGPNTGGKTVTLKTVGLLCLMAQSGMFIPADDTSVLSVFPALFADIGDEQSIAQSLSTFSAHMRTVIGMLREVTPDSLVLLDELGAGTDPREGSALARSLLAELLELGPLTVATTHYSEVKAYAFATPGVENASVEFDIQTLAPTYRLTVGTPGQSNALAIARRLGMPETVLDRAGTLVDPDEVRVDELLQDIRLRREEVDAALERARSAEQSTRQLRLVAARELRDAERERQEARAVALEQAESELSEARETFKRLQRDREAVSLTRDHLDGRRQDVDRAADAVRVFRRQRVQPGRVIPGAREIRAGDRVRVVSLGQEGDVLAVADGVAEVALGTLRTRQPLVALERTGRAIQSTARSVFRPVSPDPVDLELDLRGYRAGEIEPMLDRYLENAYRSGMPFVRIIHGKGTGALRTVVRDFLSDHPAIAKYEFAGPREGGDGATVATLREQ